MKWFLVLLAIGLTASEKLDRAYLPPSGAQFAGGNPGDIQVPLELPNPSQSGTIQIGPNINGIQDFGTGGQATQVPVTTTSYAFTQTTTYPPIESYETTVVPINPVTGLPIQHFREPGFQQHSQNLPQSNNQLAPSYNAVIQPGFVSQGQISNGQPINIGSTYTQTENRPDNQYPNQPSILSGGISQQPGSNEVFTQYPNNQASKQTYNQYSNQKDSPGATIPIPGQGYQGSGENQGSLQYPGGQNIPGQQDSIPSTASPQLTPSNNFPDSEFIEIGHKGPHLGPLPQGTYSGEPIQVQDGGNPQFIQVHQNPGQADHSGILQQSSSANQNIQSPESNVGQLTYQPGQGYNGVTGSTSSPGIVSSTSAYSDVGSIIRPERPQAAGDRNAVILNYENVRTPNGYFYSYDTSNGIHADESGIVDDGTKAQGSYSYTGDDGKVYSVVYTADENGFQPHGDHIPTAPPIPEAIKKVIEQAARDKAAGIIDDGSYDEAKYGHKNYQTPHIHRKPQIPGINEYNGNQLGNKKDDGLKPISGITDEEYDEQTLQNQLGDNISVEGTKRRPISPSRQPTNKMSGQIQDKTRPSGQPNVGTENPFALENNDNIQQNELYRKQPGSYGYKPVTLDGVKDTKIQYPGSIFKDSENTGNYPEDDATKEFQFTEGDNQSLDNGSPEYYSPGESSTSLTSGTRQQNASQKPKGSRRPDASNTKYTKGNRPQSSHAYNQGDVEDFIDEQKDVSSTQPIFGQKNSDMFPSSQENNPQAEKKGYLYDPPRTQFPTRFKDQQISSTIKPGAYKIFGKTSTVKPFLTPEVYNQPSSGKQVGQNRDRYPTTLRPFMTSRVTTPDNSLYNDYSDGEDYATDIDDESTGSTVRPDKSGSRRPSQPTQSTSRPQYAPFGQRTRVTQTGAVKPSQESDYYNTVTPNYTYGSTTSTPSQGSRFGSTETPKKASKKHQRRPSISRRPGSSTTVGPVLSSTPATGTTDSRYQTTRPSLRYPSTTATPSYTPNGVQQDFDSRIPYRQPGSTSQNYPTYSTTSTTAVPTTPGYQPGYGTSSPTRAPETYQPSSVGTYQNGQQYEQVRPGYSSSSNQRPTSQSFTSGTPTSRPGHYQTTHQQVPGSSTGATVRPSTSGRPGDFIVSEPTPGYSPTGSYQPDYQYGSPTPGYSTSSTPGVRPNYNSPIDTGSSGSYYSQPSPSGYEYGPPRSTYSTTVSPSTIATIPGTFITTPGRPIQEYSTTQPPYYPSAQGIYGHNPIVDGYGRPIISEQQRSYSPNGQDLGQYPGSQLINDFKGPGPSYGPNDLPSGDNLRPMYGGDQSPNYPGYYGQPQVTGEDFSGPKQPQRFDPQTGYHY